MLHPQIEGFYRGEWRFLTEGNSHVNRNVITQALAHVRDATDDESARIWASTAYHYAVMAAHCARMLGLVENV